MQLNLLEKQLDKSMTFDFAAGIQARESIQVLRKVKNCIMM